MFEAIRSGSATMSLDAVLEHLVARPHVDAVALLGSEATGETHEASDVDLLVVLASGAAAVDYAPGSRFEVVFTTIGGRAADVIVSTTGYLGVLLELDWKAPVGPEAESLVRWIAEGRSLLDRSGLLHEISERFRALAPGAWDESSARTAWWSVNFGLVKARRYASAPDPVYRAAGRWVLAVTVDAALRAYFTLRGLPWKGERHAIAHWQAGDPAFHEMFLRILEAGGTEDRLAAAERLAAAALEPAGGLWGAGRGPRSETWERLTSRR